MVCRIKNQQTFKSMPILNSSYHYSVWHAELRIGILLKVCRFVIRHITQTETETLTEANFIHRRGRWGTRRPPLIRHSYG